MTSEWILIILIEWWFFVPFLYVAEILIPLILKIHVTYGKPFYPKVKVHQEVQHPGIAINGAITSDLLPRKIYDHPRKWKRSNDITLPHHQLVCNFQKYLN